MATFKELSQQRYSVRGYKSDAVACDDLRYILECAQLAPSAVNRQPWHFYVCQSAEALQRVQQCYDREWFKTAPVVIVGCINHDEEWVRASDSRAHGIVDISIAAEHIVLAAAERGLGTCWVCNFDVEQCHRLLQMPATREPAVLIPLGYPAADTVPEKRRKPLEEIAEIV